MFFPRVGLLVFLVSSCPPTGGGVSAFSGVEIYHRTGSFSVPTTAIGKNNAAFLTPNAKKTRQGFGIFTTAITTTTTSARSSSSSSPLFLSPSDGGTTIAVVDDWPTIAQAGFFVAYYAGLACGTILGCNLLGYISKSVIGLESWRINVIDTTLPILLGIFYLLAGLGHFVVADYYQEIFPPQGTWGFWYLPGSAAFHVSWTGVVEAMGGIGLLLGVFQNTARDDELEDESSSSSLSNFFASSNLILQPLSALILFLLTIVVTPANIYMATVGLPLSMSFHVIRFAIQILLLCLLLTLAKDSFFFAWGEELD